MKKQIVIAIACMAAAFTFTDASTRPRQPHSKTASTRSIHASRYTQKSKGRSILTTPSRFDPSTGTAPKFRTGGTYRVAGTCTQQTLKNATLYLGNTAKPAPDAIVASAGSSLSRPLPNGTTQFDITFTLLRPGLLHVTIYDLDKPQQE